MGACICTCTYLFLHDLPIVNAISIDADFVGGIYLVWLILLFVVCGLEQIVELIDSLLFVLFLSLLFQCMWCA